MTYNSPKGIKRIAEENGFVVILSNTDYPKIVVIGTYHTETRFHNEQEIKNIINSLGNEEKTKIYFEGEKLNETQVNKYRDKLSMIEFLKRDKNIVLNDSEKEIYGHSGLSKKLSEAKNFKEKDTYNKEFQKMNDNRDLHMCLDEELGLIPNHKREPNKTHIQIVGADHGKFGKFEEQLKKYPHAILLCERAAKNHDTKRDGNYIAQNLLDNWIKVAHELGYVGRNKHAYDRINEKFGRGNWMRAHYFGNRVLTYDEALERYEASYYKFLKQNSKILNWLINTASDVYDIDPSNVNSGLDYNIQESEAKHLQDIAVRRVLKRLKKQLKGDHLVQIRGVDSEGYLLNPGQVQFTHPTRILDSGKESWWKKGSVEHFWQDNKILLVRPSKMILKPEYRIDEGIYYKYDERDYYFKPNEQELLYFKKGKNVRREYNNNRGKIEKLKGSFAPIAEFNF